MVKADVRRDYYAELGLSSNAEADEIRKQYRKLALKFHPDRNPGRESELTPKFQAIQEAHEVLNDPQRRLKYDTDRLRAGYGRTSAPRKSTASPQPRKPPFPTSARKPQFTGTPQPRAWTGATPSSPYGTAAPSPGASNYARYTKAGAAQWDAGHDEAKTRADAFRAFQEMKNPRPTSTGWSNFDPRTGQTNHAQNASRPQGTRPQSAYEAYHTRSTGPSTKKKNGFTPWTLNGDEPMAKNTSAYVNSASRNERFSTNFETTTAPTAKKQSDSEEAPRMPNLERTSSRYASVGGEKTYISSRLGKSAETCDRSSDEADSRSRTNPPSPKSPRSQRNTRHRSASPQPKPTRKPPVSSSSTSSSDTDEVLPNIKSRPKAIPRSRKAKNPHNAWDGNAAQRGFYKVNSDFPYTGTMHDTARHQTGQWSDGGTNSKSKNPNSPNRGSLNNKPKSKSDESFGARFTFKDFDNSTFQFTGAPTSSATTPAPVFVGTTQGQPQRQPNPVHANGQFFAGDLSDLANPSFWVPEGDKRATAERRRQGSPKKQPKTASKRPTVPKAASVSNEEEEEEVTLDPEHGSTGSRQTSNGGAEVMDIDFDTSTSKPKTSPKTKDHKAAEVPDSTDPKPSNVSKPTLFDFKNFESVAPFAPSNNGGITDLKDLKTTLPFDSKPADNARSKVRARDLHLPKPPKPPAAPEFLMASSRPGAPAEPVLMRANWEQYISAMEAYMYEWNSFNRKVLGHFNARQNLVETGLSPNWMKAAGDTNRLKLDVDGDTPEKPKQGSSMTDDASDGEQLVFGEPKGGYSAYLRGVEEDFVVREHWSVAWELHRKCIYTLGQVRDWIRNGGKMI